MCLFGYMTYSHMHHITCYTIYTVLPSHYTILYKYYDVYILCYFLVHVILHCTIYVSHTLYNTLYYVTLHRMGGGDFRINLSHKSDNDTAFIYIDNWRHYTTFQMWNCIPSPSSLRPKTNLNTATTTTTTSNTNNDSSNKRRYIMSIYTRYFENTNRFNRLALTAISNHYLYHYCALDLTYYEISVRHALYMCISIYAH